MKKNARIFVAGHRGLVGSALVRALRKQGHSHILTRTHEELDLIDAARTRRFFAKERPEFVFLAAARVGGIAANNNFPANFIYENLVLQTNVIHESWRSGVRRLFFLGSSCIYPKAAPPPLREDRLLTGPLEPTNRPYAVAKIAGIEMCWAYNRQFKTRFLAVMPSNLYGVNDNFDLETSHVIPALLRKFHEAKTRRSDEVVVWGSGRPRREFLHSDDLADALMVLARAPDDRFLPLLGQDRNDGTPPLVNVGSGRDVSIAELASLIAKVVGFSGRIWFDRSRPDGTFQKRMSTSLLRKWGWVPARGLAQGLSEVYAANFQRDLK